MRSALPLGAVLALVALGAAASGGCTGGSTLDSGDGGLEGGGTDGASVDASLPDASSGDSSSSDAGFMCGLVGGSYDGLKACNTVADCTTVARGCYCGAQPVIGIAKASAALAQSCESKAASQCALGCANFPGQVAEDGANNEDGGTITVLCDSGKCHTVLR